MFLDLLDALVLPAFLAELGLLGFPAGAELRQGLFLLAFGFVGGKLVL